MIENFNNIYLLILFVLFLMLFGVYLVRIVFAPEGLAKEFNADKSAILPLRYVGTFAAGIIFLGVYILFRPDGPAGTWAYFNLLFIVSIFQLLYDLLFYFKILDTIIQQISI